MPEADQSFGVKVVVIGGGTGSYTLLMGFKNYFQHLTAVVNMVDSGGSTGMLRDEYGALPPGDVRQCLVALSSAPQVMRELFNYRFPGGMFEGHAFGNMFLSALEKVTGSFAEAVREAGVVLAIRGRVLPATLDDTQLYLRPRTGPVVKGEHAVDRAIIEINQQVLPELFLDPVPQVNPEVLAALDEATVIVVAPGDIYTSIAPNFLVPDLAAAVRKSTAKKIYVCNLISQRGLTNHFQVDNFVAAIEHYAGGKLFDYVLYNNVKPPDELLKLYAAEGEWVRFDEAKHKSLPARYIGESLLLQYVAPANPHDTLVKRTLIRHDADKVARMVMRLAI